MMAMREKILRALREDHGMEQKSAEAIVETMLRVMSEPSEGMLKRAFARMNDTPAGEWKRLKAMNLPPKEIFYIKMRPRWEAMIDAIREGK